MDLNGKTISVKVVFNEINKNKSIIQNCQKMQSYMNKNFNFGYDTIEDILNDLKDELNEMYDEIENNNIDKLEMELGDIIFVLCNLSNKFGIELDKALEKSTNEYQKRIEFIENKIGNKNLTKENINQLWREAKDRNEKENITWPNKR